MIQDVRKIIKEKINDKDINKILDVANNDISIIKEKYKLSEGKNIKNIVGWLILAIKNNYEIKENIINNYGEYNFELLEVKAREKLLKQLNNN